MFQRKLIAVAEGGIFRLSFASVGLLRIALIHGFASLAGLCGAVCWPFKG
jgi:hypothetical protein